MIEQNERQNEVNKSVLKCIENIHTHTISNREEIKDLQKTIKVIMLIFLGVMTCIGILAFKTWGM